MAKQYMNVTKSERHYCDACGKSSNELFEVSFVCETETHKISHSFAMCKDCVEQLSEKSKQIKHSA